MEQNKHRETPMVPMRRRDFGHNIVGSGSCELPVTCPQMSVTLSPVEGGEGRLSGEPGGRSPGSMAVLFAPPSPPESGQ